MDKKVSNRLLSQDFFENFFKEFLAAEGASKKTQKNYLSDVRHFMQWITNHTTYAEMNQQTLHLIQPQHIAQYLTFLTQDHKAATGVRRLSSLKTFFRACQKAHFITSNPAQEHSFSQQQSRTQNKTKELQLMEWEITQLREGIHPSQVQNDITHVKDFIEWINKYRNTN